MQFLSICVCLPKCNIGFVVFLNKKNIYFKQQILPMFNVFLSIRKDNKYYDTSQMQNELEFLFWYSMICMNITLSCFINTSMLKHFKF